MRSQPILTAGLTMVALISTAQASTVTLAQGTANTSQSGFSPDEAIDGITNDSQNGWATGGSYPGIAVWETTLDTPAFVGGTRMTFNLIQNYDVPNLQHKIERFRLSVTTDGRGDFADGLDNGGDVIANWTTLAPFSATSSGTTLTINGDDSITASGTTPPQDTYVIIADTSMTGITGIRLEVFDGLSAGDNFVLSEMTLDVVAAAPVPAPAAAGGFGLLALTGLRRRRIA